MSRHSKCIYLNIDYMKCKQNQAMFSHSTHVVRIYSKDKLFSHITCLLRRLFERYSKGDSYTALDIKLLRYLG